MHELAVADDRPASAGRRGRCARRRLTGARATASRRNDAVSIVPVMASDEERLRDKHFDALEPGELARSTG